MERQTSRYEHLIGKIIDDRFEILQVKGIGGMAVVLKAKDRKTGRIVAIKMLNEKHSRDNASVRRFVSEARAIALLSNEHIVDIYDVCFDQRYKYIVMEYIDGITLREYMKRNAPIGLEKALDFTMQILSALQHAHDKGVVHRDIKPQNIMVQANGKLKVTDFGIAQISDTKPTGDGVAMGTVYYISPEQASGKTTTFSSDIYSVGVMLYEMVTGRLPFEGDTPLSIAMMQVNTQPVRPRKLDPSIPQGVEQIILRAMTKAPEGRFRSARSMLRACEIMKKDKTAVFEESTKPVARGAAKPATGATPPAVKKPEARTLFPVILGVFSAFILVIATAGIILLSSLIGMANEDNTVLIDIPVLVGRELTEDLISSLETENIHLNVTEVNNDHYAKGCITYQDPLGNTTRKIPNRDRYIEINVQVSLGKQSFVLEDLANREHRNVRIDLEGRGAKVVVEERFDNAVIAGYVITTAPEPGASINNGDTVTLYVSKGSETAYSNMIDVQGEKSEEACRKLLAANFVVGKRSFEYSDTVPAGCVIRQSVAPGTSTAQKYTAVDLVISLGKR